MKRRVVFFSMVLALILLCGCVAGGGTAKQGQQAPAFSLKDAATGESVNFPGDFKGMKTALFFFSTG